MSTTSNCGCGCGATDSTECFCPTGVRGSQIRFGDGAPVVISTDLAGDMYIERDSTPAGEVWSFNGVLWTDEGFPMQGDTGSAGQDGTTIIYNDHTQVTASGAGTTDPMQTFTMTAATLATNGSQLIVETYFDTADSGIKVNTVLIDGNTINAVALSGTLNRRAYLKNILTRTSATTLRNQSYYQTTTTTGIPVTEFNLYSTTNVTVSDLDANPVIIKTVGVITSGSQNNEYLTVTLKNKI